MNNKNVTFILLLVAGIFLLQSCYHVSYNAMGSNAPVAMRTGHGHGSMKVVGNFEYTARTWYILPFITMKDHDLRNAVDKAMAEYGGNAVVDVQLKEAMSIIDIGIGLVQQLFIGSQVVYSRTITVTGNVVKMEGGNAEETTLKSFEQAGSQFFAQKN